MLRSDLVRKRLLGAGELQRLPPEAYDRRTTRTVYRQIAERAAQLLGEGCSVITDAVHGGRDERARIEAVAGAARVPFTGFWLEAPPAILENRIAERLKDASDATIRVLHLQLSSMTAPGGWIKLDAQRSAADVLAKARACLGR